MKKLAMTLSAALCAGALLGATDEIGMAVARTFAGKTAVITGAAKAGAPHDVRVFCVAPGSVLTREAMGKMQTVLGRAIEPKEIVDFVLYLASDSCPSVTGSTHLVDAGRLCVGRGSTAGFLEAGK